MRPSPRDVPSKTTHGPNLANDAETGSNPAAFSLLQSLGWLFITITKLFTPDSNSKKVIRCSSGRGSTGYFSELPPSVCSLVRSSQSSIFRENVCWLLKWSKFVGQRHFQVPDCLLVVGDGRRGTVAERRVNESAQAKINDSDLASVIDQNVGGSEVSVRDS